MGDSGFRVGSELVTIRHHSRQIFYRRPLMGGNGDRVDV